MRSRGSATLVAGLLVLPLAGCYQGAGMTISDQAPTGNGTYLTVSDTLQIQNLVVVAGADPSKSAAIVLTVLNTDDVAEGITEVQVSGAAAQVSPSPIAVPAGGKAEIGGTSANQVQAAKLTTPTGSYASVVLKFQRGGVVSTKALVVPPTGFYEPYAAKSTTSPSDSATPED